jgi:hypothetical protein
LRTCCRIAGSTGIPRADWSTATSKPASPKSVAANAALGAASCAGPRRNSTDPLYQPGHVRPGSFMRSSRVTNRRPPNSSSQPQRSSSDRYLSATNFRKGAASSLLANLAFAIGDTRFIKLCRKRQLRYSRYVDDIAVSGNKDFSDLRGPFEDAIRSAGYSIAKEKIHFRSRSERQVVIGFVVNEKMRPTNKYLSTLKYEIQLCPNHGARRAAICRGVTVPQLKSQLTGRVSHVRHIDRRLGQSLRGKLFGVDWRSTLKS